VTRLLNFRFRPEVVVVVTDGELTIDISIEDACKLAAGYLEAFATVDVRTIEALLEILLWDNGRTTSSGLKSMSA
jgi:hypothetical protein